MSNLHDLRTMRVATRRLIENGEIQYCHQHCCLNSLKNALNHFDASISFTTEKTAEKTRLWAASAVPSLHKKCHLFSAELSRRRRRRRRQLRLRSDTKQPTDFFCSQNLNDSTYNNDTSFSTAYSKTSLGWKVCCCSEFYIAVSLVV